MQFEVVKKDQADMVREWLGQDYVAEYWYGIGLQNTLDSFDDFVNGRKTIFTHWIAYVDDVPFGFLMTSKVDLGEDELYAKYCDLKAKAITLDLLIGSRSYLGQGLGHRMIKEFLKQKFSDITDVFIDPSVDNHRAIHVYEKSGFKRLEEFTPEWDSSKRCLLMHFKEGYDCV